MSMQNLPNSPRRVLNHYLVFVHGYKLSPLFLNDKQNSYEVYSITSRTEVVDCFRSQRPGCLVANADSDFLSYPSNNMMSRLLPIVMISNTSAIPVVSDAVRRGAHSVIRDIKNQDDLREAICNACAADSYEDVGPARMRVLINKLTTKEKQIIYMSIRGKTTKIISHELGVCHQTVDKHKKRAMRKLRTDNIIDLMNALLDCHRLASGLVQPKFQSSLTQYRPSNHDVAPAPNRLK